MSQLGRYAYLLNNGSDVLYGIVGCSVELLYVGASSFVEGATTFAFVTGITFFLGVKTIDGFGKDSGTGGLTDPSWTAEKVGPCEFVLYNRSF